MDPKAFIDDAPMVEEAFVFGGFRLLPAQRLLLEDEKPVHLGSRKLDVLFALVQNAGDTLHKDQCFFRQFQGRWLGSFYSGRVTIGRRALGIGKRKRGAKSIEGIERCRLLLRYECISLICNL